MAMTPEGKVKEAVKKVLTEGNRKHKIYQFWPVQSGYGAATLDCLGAYFGQAFAIETKAPGGKPTPRQRLAIKEMEAAGIQVFVIDGDTSALEVWLADLERRVYG